MIRYEDTQEFVFPISSGQVIKVYDGDTITIASTMPYESSPLFRFHVRLTGIDTPEIRAKNTDEKEAARRAKTALENLILHQEVQLQNVRNEKYGRILADVFFKELHLNQWMIDNRFAVKYDGKTKQSPACWLKYIEGEGDGDGDSA